MKMKKKRNFSRTFLEKKKKPTLELEKKNTNECEEPKKKKRKFQRNSISMNKKAEIIRWSKKNKTKTAQEIKKQFSVLKNISLRTIQKWRHIPESKVLQFEMSEKKRQTKRVSLFPHIEEELLKRRKERVISGRDRSKFWMEKEVKKIIKDSDVLEKLELNDFEKKNISKFNGSKGFVNKVIARNKLDVIKIQTQRKITQYEYLTQRKKFLKNERKYWKELGLSNESLYNADEIPLILAKKSPKQVTIKGEMTSVKSPPIVGHNKYRDCTLVPFINMDKIIFVGVVLKGGPSITKNAVPKFNKQYGKYLHVFCNEKGYVTNYIWTELIKRFIIKTRKVRGTDAFGLSAKNPIILYSDNCLVHSTDEQKKKYVQRHKIHERSLLQNCTHLQQPVDQHVGKFLQEKLQQKYWEWGETLLDNVEEGKRNGKKKRRDESKKNQNCSMVLRSGIRF